jgi:glycine/D-amino acid oxidase-like deaminating enzyme
MRDEAGRARGEDGRYRALSLWLDRYPGSLRPSNPLGGDEHSDIAIVGAGFTGLWTAYYLQRADPSARIVLLERDIAGFGASGRNGGWCSALFPTSWARIARQQGDAAALAMRDAMRGAVREVGEVAAAEGIDCDYHRGGTLTLTRTPAQLARGEAEVAEAADCGDDDLRWLDAAAVAEIAGAPGALGATFTPHCAVIDPARLVRGLAEVVVARGAVLHEGTAVTAIAPHRVRTARGTVTADVVVRATEAFTPQLPGHRRDLAPIYSLIVATEPLADRVLDAVGLADRPTFADLGHLICYGQRTADGRIVFGGRGAPYHFGSSLAPGHDRDERVFARLRTMLVEMFPALHGVSFTHSWGGAVAAPRDWHASVVFDPATGLGHAGGYVGDGVATTNLAGRTLADLVIGIDSDLTGLPWVGHRSRRWEPEPVRWLGVNAGLAMAKLADRVENRTGRPSGAARVLARLTGG